MKYYPHLLLLIIFSINSCTQGEETSENSSLTDDTEELNNEEGSEYTDELIPSSTPENVKVLLELFQLAEKDIDSSCLDLLHENPENTTFGYQTSCCANVEKGYAFVYYSFQGASDLYGFTNYSIAYFNTKGDYLNTVSVNCNDNTVNVNFIGDRFICITNDYPEYIEDDERHILLRLLS